MMDIDRAAKIELALEDYEAQKMTRTETIEFRGIQRTLKVVTISPEVPLLNPNNSRLQAQLANHPSNSEMITNPFLSKAQTVLEELLSQTEKFSALKEQLVDFGQQEPGIISATGLLVNGNTRLAAVRSLGIDGFDVAILPKDATDDDFFNIEMSLQLRNLIQQDYTFTNRLLLVGNHLQRTDNEDSTIRAMQWKRNGKQKLREHRGYLQLVEEIRQLNPQLSYSYFDSKEELIKNLYSQYTILLASSPKAAETLKWTRIQGMLLGLNKDEVREIDEEFLLTEVLPAIEGERLEDYFRKFRTTDQSDAALDELLGIAEANEFDLRGIAKDIAGEVVNKEGSVTDESIESKFKDLHDRYRRTARSLREDRISHEMRTEPVVYLQDVTQRIQILADRIPVMFEDQHFNKKQFEYQVKKADTAIQQLKDALKRKLKE